MTVCVSCGTSVVSWLQKFEGQNKVYLDHLYFEENKIPYREDERGPHITGEKFIEIESEKAKIRCPKCGSKRDEDIIWGPI